MKCLQKKGKILFLIFVFLILFSDFSLASAPSDQLSAMEEQVGYSDFLQTIPSECLDWLESFGVDLSAETSFPGLVDIFAFCWSYGLSVLREYLPLLSIGIALLLFLKLVSAYSFGSSRLVESLGFLTAVTSGVYSFSVIQTLFSALTQAVSQASAFLTASLPVAMSARLWSGSPSASTVLSLSLPPILSVMSTFVSSLYHPLCLFCYAASLCGFFRGELSLRPMVSGVRRFCVRGVGIVSGLSVGVFCIQKAAAASGDSVARRGIRFALAQILPIAGGALTDGVETVYACGRALSGKIGVICVLVLFSLFVFPCLLGFLLMALYSLLSSVGGLFDVPLLTDFYGDVKDTVAVLTSFAVCSLTVLSSAMLLMMGG